ncbi:MAG: DUF3107 domain-containing protein [Microbacteriaceae bacterium]|nr:DUF3107 domain-containing protein [Microbacteriaceae bacterium]
MEVRIGIKHSPRELSFEVDTSPADVRALVEKAVANDAELLTLTDTKGRQFLIDTDSIAYIEIGAEAGRRVGFVS